MMRYILTEYVKIMTDLTWIQMDWTFWKTVRPDKLLGRQTGYVKTQKH